MMMHGRQMGGLTQVPAYLSNNIGCIIDFNTFLFQRVSAKVTLPDCAPTHLLLTNVLLLFCVCFVFCLPLISLLNIWTKI